MRVVNPPFETVTLWHRMFWATAARHTEHLYCCQIKSIWCQLCSNV